MIIAIGFELNTQGNNPIFGTPIRIISKNKLDIILPCFNPPENWKDSFIESATLCIEKLPDVSIRFILVNDGSKKSLQSDIHYIVQKIEDVSLVEYSPNQGKGYAIRQGLIQSKANYVIFTDYDFPYTEQNIADVYSHLIEQQADLVLGNRSDDYYDDIPKSRKLLSNMVKRILKVVLNIPVSDTQCGLKGFSSKGKEYLAATTINRYLFDVELIQNAANSQNCKILTCPVQLKPNIQFRAMGLTILMTEFWNLVKLILRR